eukprot:9301103-Pyramimonas_sp.AAC.1
MVTTPYFWPYSSARRKEGRRVPPANPAPPQPDASDLRMGAGALIRRQREDMRGFKVNRLPVSAYAQESTFLCQVVFGAFPKRLKIPGAPL